MTEIDLLARIDEYILVDDLRRKLQKKLEELSGHNWDVCACRELWDYRYACEASGTGYKIQTEWHDVGRLNSDNLERLADRDARLVYVYYQSRRKEPLV